MVAVIRSGLWLVFVAILCAVGYVALRACVLTLPGFGIVVQRCPVSVVAMEGETAVLVSKLQMLKVAATQAKQCDEPDIALPKIQKAEQVILILDTSASMTTEVEMTRMPKEIGSAAGIHIMRRRLENIASERLLPGANVSALDLEVQQIEARLRAHQTASQPSKTTRFDIAKEAILALLEAPSQNLPISLWQYGACDGPSPKVYPIGNDSPRPVVEALLANANSSALARSLENLPSMISAGAGMTADRAVNVLLFADGDDNCKAIDKCASAVALKAQLPFVYIHVVSISEDLEKLSCIAESTGGAMIESLDSEEIKRAAITIMRRSQ